VVTGRVSLAPELAGRVQPDDTVFIFARPLQGSRMPVALMRRKARELPLEFKLDDSMAMVPDIKLSMLAKVAVGARVSRRGDATPHAGDLQGLVEPVALGSRDVQVRIGEVLP
jgi:cytochrome c-type biogenesis protein CcmH